MLYGIEATTSGTGVQTRRRWFAVEAQGHKERGAAFDVTDEQRQFQQRGAGLHAVDCPAWAVAASVL
jgi:hypothetical protein